MERNFRGDLPINTHTKKKNASTFLPRKIYIYIKNVDIIPTEEKRRKKNTHKEKKHSHAKKIEEGEEKRAKQKHYAWETHGQRAGTHLVDEFLILWPSSRIT